MKIAVAFVAGVIIVLGFLSVTDIGTVRAEFPEQCEDEDRENPNNRNSSCKFVGELVLEKLEWIVYPEYPECHSKLRFHLTGHEDMVSIPHAMIDLIGGDYTDAHGHISYAVT